MVLFTAVFLAFAFPTNGTEPNQDQNQDSSVSFNDVAKTVAEVSGDNSIQTDEGDVIEEAPSNEPTNASPATLTPLSKDKKTSKDIKGKNETIENKSTTPDVIESTDEPTKPENNYTNSVILQGLDKITARTSKLKAEIGKPTKFGNLSINLLSCWRSPPEETKESKALIEIWEEIPGEVRKKIFSGWMFASSPFISAPEHLIYDITVLECV